MLLVRVELVTYAQEAGKADDGTLDARVSRSGSSCVTLIELLYRFCSFLSSSSSGSHKAKSMAGDMQAGAAGSIRTRVGKERLVDGRAA